MRGLVSVILREMTNEWSGQGSLILDSKRRKIAKSSPINHCGRRVFVRGNRREVEDCQSILH